MFHPPGKVDAEGMAAKEISASALEMWIASLGQIQCLTKYGLGFRITEQEKWRQTLELLSRVVEVWGFNRTKP